MKEQRTEEQWRQSRIMLRVEAVTSLFLVFSAIGCLSSTAHDPGERPLTSLMLSGRTLEADGRLLEGVAVSARAVDRTFTTTVYSDEQGNYIFPALNQGRYQVWAQAVGYSTSRTELDLDPAHQIRHEFTLESIDDFSNQLSGTEWLDALPEDTFENRRLKEVLRIRCTECHSAGTILQNRFDEAGWRSIVNAMAHADSSGIALERPSATIEYHKEEMVSYLTRMRGPGPSPMKFKPYPRPRGEAARVVITEYDIPPGESPDSLVTSDGSDWQEGNPSTDGVGHGIHDVHVDFDGNAWAVDSKLNTGRTYVRIDTSTGEVTGFKVPAPPDGRFARASHAIITDPRGILWLDVRANAGLTGFGSLGRVDPRTEELTLFTPPEEMSTGINRTLDWDGLGRIWASTSSGAIMFDSSTEQFEHYPAVTPGGAIASYGVAGDADGNGWWTQSGQDIVAVADTRTGKVHEIRMQPRTDLKDLITEEDREFYGKRIVWAEQQYPRRLGADKKGNTVWVPNFVGENLARIDTRTHEVKYYPVPFDSNPYYVVVDKNQMVWVNLTTNDRVARFDPGTEEWAIFVLPSLGAHTRNIAVDNTRDPVEVWVPYFRTSRVARLQFRSQDLIETALASRR